MAGPAHKPALLPPAWLGVAVVAMAALHYFLPLRTLLTMPSTLAGIAPILAGCALNISADLAFKRGKTTVRPFERPSRLITDGVFTLSRNPMYAGMVLILFGFALLLGSLSPFVVVIAFAILLDRRFIWPEEQILAERFGAAWLAYRGKVRRWI